MTIDGQLLAICVSAKKGTVKHPVEGDACSVRAGHGIEGDAHAGSGHRQLSALASESIVRMQEKLPDLRQGAFGENLITKGIDWSKLAVGRRLRVGDGLVLQLTQHGKTCHNRCAIYDATGDCIMPTEGVFFVARTSGEIVAGDTIGTDAGLDAIRYAVVTASDRSAAGEREDLSGPRIEELVATHVDSATLRVAREIVPDNRGRIADLLRRLCDEEVVDVVFTTGGTGAAPRDVTPEATSDVIDRELPGIAEAIRAAGLAHTPHAMLSRAICGQRGRTLIINLSGSPKAVTEQLEVVFPALPHAVAVISGVPQDCART